MDILITEARSLAARARSHRPARDPAANSQRPDPRAGAGCAPTCRSRATIDAASRARAHPGTDRRSRPSRARSAARDAGGAARGRPADERSSAMAVRARRCSRRASRRRATVAVERGGSMPCAARIDDGDCLGPRLLCCGQPLTTPDGHCAFWGGVATTTSELERVVARQLEAGQRLDQGDGDGRRLHARQSPPRHPVR